MQRPMSSRMSVASVGALWAIYHPFGGASHEHVKADPDTHSRRSLLRDDSRYGQ
jgi:hypothetical protein